jgi:hypothetical protein
LVIVILLGKSPIIRPHRHGVDRQLVAVVAPNDRDHLQHGRASARSEVKAEVVFEFLDHHRVAHGVLDVLDVEA